MTDLSSDILTQRQAAEDFLSQKRSLWDQAEELLHNKVQDLMSSSTKSRVFDPKLSTLALERSFRVMAQLPMGKVRGISKNDIGDAMLKNLLLEKYVLPNANAQFDFLTKMRLVDLYSNVYGNFFTLIDWDVRQNGYVGPDVWLLNIRDVFPQVGAVSLDDSDYVIVRTWKPLSYFKNLKKQDGFKNIDQILNLLDPKTGSKQNRGSESLSKREEESPNTSPAKNKGFFEVLTRFEKDRWVDICVDADGLEFRDQENPHGDDDLPVKCKYSIPLLDDFMGMGDFERGGSMQRTVNSIWNLYLDGVKMSIFPPVLVNKDNIASMSSLSMTAAAKWLVRNQIGNAAQPLTLNPQGTSTFNNVYQVATAALLNMFGTSDTNVTQATDPGYGKTPQALKMQAQRENTRDVADRFYMEQYLTQVMKKFCNLLSKKQSSAVTVRMFNDEIEEIARSYPEIRDSYDETKGKLTVKKGGSELYDYEIVSGSTYAADEKAQQENLSLMFQIWKESQMPNGMNMLEEKLKMEGFQFKFGELFKRLISKGGIQDWDKILVEMTPQEKDDNVLAQTDQQFQQALMQMTGNVNATPAQPDQIGQQIQQPMDQQAPAY